MMTESDLMLAGFVNQDLQGCWQSTPGVYIILKNDTSRGAVAFFRNRFVFSGTAALTLMGF